MKRCLPMAMWLLAVSFFTFQFILRLFPGLVVFQLMDQLSVDSTKFGIVMSAYYYGYAGLHIPMAALLDKYSPRIVMSVCAVLCGISSLMFAHTHSFVMATFLRFMVGACSAAGILGSLKIASQWLDKKHYSKISGFTLTIALIGALYGGAPVSNLLDKFGYDFVNLALAIASAVIGVLLLLFLRSPKVPEGEDEGHLSMKDFKSLIASPTIWILGIANLLMVGALEGFADVWGVQYLVNAYGMTKGTAAGLSSIIFIGMLSAGPVLGFLSNKINDFVGIALCGLGIAALFWVLMFFRCADTNFLAALFFAIGFFCGYQALIFAVCPKISTKKFLGVTTAFLNGMNMLGGSFFHTAIGCVMDMCWNGARDTAGSPIYTIDGYNYALLIIPISSLIGAVMCVYLVVNRGKKIGE